MHRNKMSAYSILVLQTTGRRTWSRPVYLTGNIAPAIRDWIEKIRRVKRLVPGALAICENAIATSLSGDRHGSGAYSVFIDQQAGAAPAFRRVTPPTSSFRVLSLAYDNFGEAGAPPTIPATVRVLRGSGTVDTLNVTIEVGRKWFHFLHADDQAASVQLNPPASFRPQVTALVEYTTP